MLRANSTLLVTHWFTGSPHQVNLTTVGTAYVSTQLQNVPVAPAWYLAPLLFDPQVNGYAGVDFQGGEVALKDLEGAVRRLHQDGCGSFFLTLITDEWSCLMDRLAYFRRLREKSPALQRAISGWHLEGPFLSAEPGYHGAHDPRAMLNPLPKHIQQIRDLTGTDRVLLTMAPERQGALAAIRQAVNLGMKVSLGHTNASFEILSQAVQAGATGFTHLGNGCPRDLDRHDNILWRVAALPPLVVSMIPDGIHVSPQPFQLWHRLCEQHRIIYTTDAMAAAGAPPGRYRLGRLEVDVGSDQVVRQPGQINFAGSALRPVDGAFRAAAMLGVRWQQTWRRMCEFSPSAFGARQGHKHVSIGHFCLFQMAEDGTPRNLRCYVDRKEIT